MIRTTRIILKHYKNILFLKRKARRNNHIFILQENSVLNNAKPNYGKTGFENKSKKKRNVTFQHPSHCPRPTLQIQLRSSASLKSTYHKNKKKRLSSNGMFFAFSSLLSHYNRPLLRLRMNPNRSSSSKTNRHLN